MKKSTLFLALCLVLLTACKKSDSSTPETTQPTQSKRVVLAYMFGDVNLWENIIESVNQMEEGAPDKENGTLLVYLDWSPSVTQFRAPVLLEISHDKTNSITSRVVKTYPQNQDAGDPPVFAAVLKQVTEEYPADSYGLLMAGHGSGWVVPPPSTESKSIGNSERLNGHYLDIDKLAAAIPASLHFDFIAFHSCVMAEAAVLYELKNKCDYVVASVETFPSFGFPYHLATKDLFAQPHADLYNFIKTTTEYYNNNVDKNMIDFYTMGLYKMDKMEQLAKAVKEVMDVSPLSYDQLRNELWSIIGNNRFDSLMMYPWLKIVPRKENKQPFYDFTLLTTVMVQYNESAARNLANAITDVVKRKDVVLGGKTHNQSFDQYRQYASGISFYIPNKNVSAESDKAFYERFGWSKAAGFTQNRDQNPIQ